MGYTKHDALLITTWDSRVGEIIDAFRGGLEKDMASLIQGPLPGVANGVFTFVVVPDGSKQGWPTSHNTRALRRALLTVLRLERECFFDAVVVEFGGEFGGENPPRATDPMAKEGG